MNNKDDIRMLTERFFYGDTTIEEERELYRLYQGHDVPQDLQAYREMMLDLAAIGAEEYSIMDKQETIDIPIWRRPFFRWIAAAVVALLVIGGATTLFMHNSEEECVAYIYGQKVTDHNVVMNELSQTAMSMANSRGDDDVAQQLDEMFN
jgi:hypothetical protein